METNYLVVCMYVISFEKYVCNQNYFQEYFEKVEEAKELDRSKDTAKDKEDNEHKNKQDDEQEDEIEGGMDTAKPGQENGIKSDQIICKDSRGRSPIFNACEKNNLSALKLLLEAGFDPDEEDREGWRPIQVAMSKEAKECVWHLLRSSGQVRKRTQAYELTYF